VIEQIPLIHLNAYATTLEGVDNATIAEQILTGSTPVDPDHTKWHSHDRVHSYYEDTLPPRTPEIADLETRIVDTIQQIRGGTAYEITELWSIITGDRESIAAHNHRLNTHIDPLEYFAFAYYPQAPTGSADLVFHVGYCHAVEQAVSVPVETGKLIIFNAFVLHFTEKQFADGIRVNLSGNLAPVSPNIEPSVDWSPYWRRKQ